METLSKPGLPCNPGKASQHKDQDLMKIRSKHTDDSVSVGTGHIYTNISEALTTRALGNTPRWLRTEKWICKWLSQREWKKSKITEKLCSPIKLLPSLMDSNSTQSLGEKSQGLQCSACLNRLGIPSAQSSSKQPLHINHKETCICWLQRLSLHQLSRSLRRIAKIGLKDREEERVHPVRNPDCQRNALPRAIVKRPKQEQTAYFRDFRIWARQKQQLIP